MAEPKPENTLVISHWAKLIEGFQMAPRELYSLVEEKVRARAVPKVQPSRVDWHEGGAFSDKREYLRLHRGDLDPAEDITPQHVSQAIRYRTFDRTLWV